MIPIDEDEVDSSTFVVNNEETFGTLFLDEIGDTPLDVQGMLLRLLSDKPEITPLGTEGIIQIKRLRIIAATSNPHWCNLAGITTERDENRQAVKPDLFYRLAWHRIHVRDLEPWELPIFIARQRASDWSPEAVEYLQESIKNKQLRGHRRELRSILDLTDEFVEKNKQLGLPLGTKVSKEVIDLVWKPAEVTIPLRLNNQAIYQDKSDLSRSSEKIEMELLALLAYCFNAFKDSCDPMDDWFIDGQLDWKKAKEGLNISSFGRLTNVSQEKHESLMCRVIIWAIRLVRGHDKTEVKEIHKVLCDAFNKHIGFTRKHMKGQYPLEWYLGTGAMNKSNTGNRKKTIKFMIAQGFVQNEEEFESLIGKGRVMEKLYSVMKSATLYELISTWPQTA